MLTEKFNYELEHAKGLKKIYELNYAVTKLKQIIFLTKIVFLHIKFFINFKNFQNKLFTKWNFSF